MKPIRTMTLYLLLVVTTVVIVTPLIWLVIAAFKYTEDYSNYTFLPPVRTETDVRVAAGERVDEAVRRLEGLTNALTPVDDAPREKIVALIAEMRDSVVQREQVRQTGYPLQRVERIEPPLDLSDIPADELVERQVLRGDHALWESFAERAMGIAGELSDPFGNQVRLALTDLVNVLNAQADLVLQQETVTGTRLTLDNFYREPEYEGGKPGGIFGEIDFQRFMMNSFFVTGATVLLQLFFSALGGFALAKYEFVGKRPIMIIMLATLMIPGPVLMAPLYELIFHFKLIDTHAGLIVPGLVSVFGMFLFRQSMLAIPDDLLQAGRIDGCSEFGLFWNVALPVSRPMIGAFCLIAFMGTWNSFLWPQIILQNSDNFTLPIGLRQMIGVYQEDYGALMAGTLLSILPIVALFFTLQREFIAGLTAGAVKG